MFDTRREAFQTQINALDQLKSYLEKEVTSLEEQLKVHEIEANSVKTEYDMVKKLYAKGLTAAPRKLALQRNMAQVDGDRLRLESSLMRARQEISRTKISIVDLQAKRSSEISSEMQKAQARLDELKGRTATSKNLLFETEVLAPQMIAEDESSKERPPIFKVRRRGSDAASEEVTVNQDAVVEPGDTIMVELPPRREASVSVPLPALGESTTPTASIFSDRLR